MLSKQSLIDSVGAFFPNHTWMDACTADIKVT